MRKTFFKRGATAAAGLAFAIVALTSSMNSRSESTNVVSETHQHARLAAPIGNAPGPRFASGSNDYLADVCVQGMYHWPASRLPVKVYIHTASDVPGYRANFNDMIRKSFDAWTNSSGGKLSWKEVSDRTSADVTVDWSTTVKQLPQGTEAGETNALTRLNTVTGKGIIYGARMHFLTQLNGASFSDTEMYRTCLHETGHALGLQGHSPNPADVMYYAISKRQAAVLSSRDRQTMTSLYRQAPATDAIALNPAGTGTGTGNN
jgi:predicted Zn-dependent protease